MNTAGSGATAATSNTPSMQQVSLEDFADLLDESAVTERLDLHSALVYKVTHPTKGNLVLVNTTGEQHGIIQC